MNIKLIRFLLLLSAMLVFVIASEWWYVSRAQKQLMASIEKGDKQQKTLAQLPMLELTRQPESSFVNLVNRPLFIQGRRPVKEAQAVAPKVKTSTVNDAFNWSLNGIYTNKKRLFALITRTSGKVPKDNYRKVAKNSEIDGWTVSNIDKDKMVLVQGENEKVLPLRKAKPKKNNVPGAMNQPPVMPPNPNDPAQIQPIPNDPAQMPPQMMPQEGMPGIVPEQVPGVPPGMQMPPDQAMPEPEVIPEEPMPETGMMPEEPSTFIENNENVPVQ